MVNTSRQAVSASCSFKYSGLLPELWDPVTGVLRNLTQFEVTDNHISVPISFDEAQSFFIVFRKKIMALKLIKKDNFPIKNEVVKIDGPWQVKFDSSWGGPAQPVSFSSLDDWSKRTEPGIKYYSGTAVYATSFNLPEIEISGGKQPILYLDLGLVNHIARIKINNQDLGVVWTAPWTIRVPSGLLKRKGNRLIIEATNTWANRLIGDEQEPPDCEWLPGQFGGNYLKEFPEWFLKNQPRPSKGRFCFTTWNYFTKDSPLISSGLLGPVRIMKEEYK